MGKLFNTFFFGMFAVIALSLGMLVYRAYTGQEDMWQIFLMVPFGLYLLHSWVIMALLAIGDFRKKTRKLYLGGKISVLMPVYNEEPELLMKAVNSVVLARGDKEIILIDDGSTNDSLDTMRKLQAYHGKRVIKIVACGQNGGKRVALWHGVKNLAKQSKYVVCLDSDTVIDKEALVRIVEPLNDPRIGATTGNIYLLNEDKNLLTRLTAAYYWTGLNIYKQAQSVMGSVACCSGCLSAYRSENIRKVIDEFIHETFFGEICTHSEDRHLTNLTLKQGLKVVYVPEAISYTKSPETMGGFLRQQKRWKRGFLRESVYALTFTWKTHPGLFFWILMWDLVMPFLILGSKIALLAVIFLDPWTFLTVIAPLWVASAGVRYLLVLFRNPSKLAGTIAFTFISELVLYWYTPYALATIKNRSWITR